MTLNQREIDNIVNVVWGELVMSPAALPESQPSNPLLVPVLRGQPFACQILGQCEALSTKTLRGQLLKLHEVRTCNEGLRSGFLKYCK